MKLVLIRSQTLADGIPLTEKTLNNWTFSDKEGTFTVKDGMIVIMVNEPYTGPVSDHNFKNFEFRADVMTEQGSFRNLFSY